MNAITQKLKSFVMPTTICLSALMSVQPFIWLWCWFDIKIAFENLQKAKIVVQIDRIKKGLWEDSLVALNPDATLPSEEVYEAEKKTKKRWGR